MTKTFNNQVKTFKKSKNGLTLVATMRYDDNCKNGHNTFSIVCTLIDNSKQKEVSWGQLTEEFLEFFPEFSHLQKWHLCSSEGPMHYVENTLYHVLEHGPKYAWVYWTGTLRPFPLEPAKEHCVGYRKVEAIPQEIFSHPEYRLKYDEKSVKIQNLDYARSSACWPEATEEDLTNPNLREVLKQRLPALLENFRKDIEAVGFKWEPES